MILDENDIKEIESRMLLSPRIIALIDERAKEIVKNAKVEPMQELTIKQLSNIWQKTARTIGSMTDEEIRQNGYIRHKRGYSVRFEKIVK